MTLLSRLLLCLALWTCALPLAAEPLPRDEIAARIVPPFSLGEPLNAQGVYSLLNSGGAEAGFVFETEPMAPLPGFSGAPINLLVTLDLQGTFQNVQLVSHNEPIFVSGLGEAAFHRFFEQYRGHSISDVLVVGTPYGAGGDGSELVYLDGVTKATASVRIAHESLMAATLQVAREKMQGIAAGPPAHPDPDHTEDLDWQTLVDQGLVGHLHVTNAEVQQAFAGTIWATDDPEALADPAGAYLDLWVIDIGPPSIARAVLDPDSLEDLARFKAVSGSDEPLLVIDTARHGLVSDDFVRNTAPDRLTAEQDGYPVALRDADLFVELAEDLPEALHDGVSMILRTDRRLGFDPTRPWQLHAQAMRAHGMFQPELGSASFSLTHTTDPRFFIRPEPVTPLPPWREALLNRQADLLVLGAFLAGLLLVLGTAQNRVAALRGFTPLRLATLAFVLGFVGWWGQGQLSIVTVLGVLRTMTEGGSLSFLLYDPFSLLVWIAAILGLIAWGRGFFCGWLCPFGALQEFAHHIGRLLRLPRIEPAPRWDARLKLVKYGLLAALVLTALLVPAEIDTVAEIEPFKTAITVHFQRDWLYVAYAGLWLALGLVLFKGFCRYACPLGAFMAGAGAVGRVFGKRSWIARRVECGSPCQLCKVRCNYGAIDARGKVNYSECFQCLDCVSIYQDETTCVPLVLAGRKAARPPRKGAESGGVVIP
ncbi:MULTISPECIES: 4Fe-4S binding protein [unclassified Meridianimarinicoccus]|uniref:4Fe-4S binding protein n=1 Tax=unclassified Meridianimarinicoccus TaxID=2923344 RepID=UPI001865B556|nr:4Fe-4S binding protein [Fluviibacterium sp. MJW13]